jgi:dipeptidyl aminopeptidase/acylaminoacyl peptidase
VGRFRAAATLAAGALALAGGAPVGAEPTAALEAYGRLPFLEDVVISPDGTKLAFVRTTADERDLLIAPVGGNTALGSARVGNAKVRALEWLDDDNLMATVSSTQGLPIGWTGGTQEWFQLITYNLPRHQGRGITFTVPGETTFSVVTGETSVRDVGGRTTLFAPGWYLGGERMLPGLFAIELVNDSARLIARGTAPRYDWLIDESGNIAADFVYHDEDKTWQIRARKDNRLQPVAAGKADIDVPSLLGFNRAGDAILVQFVDNGDSVWKPLNLKDDSWGAPLERGAQFRRTLEDRKSGRIIGGIRDIEETEYVFFDAELQAHWNAVLRAFPNERVHMASHSDDFTRIIVQVFGARDGYAYALFDWYTHQSSLLGPVYKGISAPAEVSAVSYQAADGMVIPGFLTLPRGRTPKNLPLVVFPHGGPAVVDTPDFDWWAQALAAQGYAVLQPNYRGSAVDTRFMEAGYGEWGRKMQSDLSDGVRFLAQDGIVDPKRVCIVGASYGGYAALAGVTLQSGIYRCAVSVAGMSDLNRMRVWTRREHLASSTRYWDRFWGVGDQDEAGLKVISPIDHIATVTAPILLIHGRDDTVVPYEQSDLMLSALKRAGKSVEMMTLKHEDHWLSRSATRLQMLEATVAFLRANNPPD